MAFPLFRSGLCYCLAGCHPLKVMDKKGFAVTRAIYNVLGVGKNGKKDLLGMYISKSEGSNFWLSVLSDLQNRGVKDILITCIDGLKGFPDAIKISGNQCTAVHCSSDTQLSEYVVSKNQKVFLADLEHVYSAVNKEDAETQFDSLETK